MVLFGSIKQTGRAGQYYPRDAMDIVVKMHTVGQLHDFEAETLSLNSAWSLCQGFRSLSELKRRGATPCHLCGTIKESSKT